MKITLIDRVVLVTGAGRGLGRTYALELAALGATVVVNDVGTAEGRPTAELVAREIVESGGRAVADLRPVDIETEAHAMVAGVVERFGRIDGLIHNAGFLRNRSVGKMTAAEIDDVLAVHLRAAFHLALPCFVQMRKQEYGRILLITSAVGLLGGFGQANYAAAKAGILGLVRSLAFEGRAFGVLANALAPLADTAMTADALGASAQDFDASLVAPMAAYLASSDCQLSGQILGAGAGRFSSFFIGATQGWQSSSAAKVSAQDVHENLERILDRTDYQVFDDAWSEIEWLKGRMTGVHH